MTRRRITVAAAVLAAAVLAGNGASAQGIEDLDGEWTGTVTGRVINSDALEMDIHLHGDHVDGRLENAGAAGAGPPVPRPGGARRERSGAGMARPPMLTLELDAIVGCEVEVTAETIETNRWGGPWHLHGDCGGVVDEGTLMVMRAGDCGAGAAAGRRAGACRDPRAARLAGASGPSLRRGVVRGS